MSEIFDFLRKTESKQGKESHDSYAEPGKEAYPLLNDHDPAIADPALPEAASVEVCATNRFDLTAASVQLKNVLDPLTLVGEQFRLLRSKLSLMQKQRGIKTILVTSSVPDEGKTFTASGLAGVFAQEPGKKIVLIDADMRKAKSGWNFGLNGSTGNCGLSEILRGNQEFSSGLFVGLSSALSFIPSGPIPSNPSELLSSPNLERVVKAAASNFDWVVIDSPPVLALADTTLIVPLVDAVILVVRANSTSSKLVADTVNQIGHDRICGIVLNRQKKIHTARYYYKYYYRSSDTQRA
jgi:capsular exopolysaccharide synthesis family protein